MLLHSQTFPVILRIPVFVGSEAVPGPRTNSAYPPVEPVRVGRQKLRPGSGLLSVGVTTDGPVLQILDIKERVRIDTSFLCSVVYSLKENSLLRKKTFALLEERDWSHIAMSHRPTQIDADVKKLNSSELDPKLHLPAGLGLSVVSQRPVEELLFARLAGISLDVTQTPLNTTLDPSVADARIDNQPFEAHCTSVLFVTRPSRTEDEEKYRPALHAVAASRGIGTLLYTSSSRHRERQAVARTLGGEIYLEASAAHAKRYYFGALKLVPNQVRNCLCPRSRVFNR